MAADVLLFDDDTFFAGLVRELLGAQGLRVLYYPTGEGALDHIRRERPQLVLTDIMMPGVDGITLCGAIKRDPELGERTKVVIVSGKGYAEDRARADSASADLFFQKPLDVKEFGRGIQSLLGGRPPMPGVAATAPSVHFWQNAGATGSATLRLGQRLFIFDAGTGLKRALEEGEGRGMSEAWVLLSKFDAKQISEIRALRQLADAGCALHLVGSDKAKLDSFGAFLRPTRPSEGPGLPEVHAIQEGRTVMIGGIRVTTMATLHPGTCLAYRVEGEGVSIVFAPSGELEPEWENSMTDYGEKLTAFVKGARLLIHDARYRVTDLPEPRGSGHSTPEAVIRLASRAGISSVVLHNLDAQYSTRDRLEIETAARKIAKCENGQLRILVSVDRAVAEVR